MINKTRRTRKGSTTAQINADGWLTRTRRVISPNADARPQADDISLLVIHGISLPPDEYGGAWIEALFTNRLDPNAHPYFADIASLRVSAHVVIRRNGQATQYVPFGARAWHAGASCFEGRPRCNDYAIGIELEGSDHRAYTARQYLRLASISRALCARYPQISAARIVGHSDIAPGRKTDPGPAFDWRRYRALLSTTASLSR